MSNEKNYTQVKFRLNDEQLAKFKKMADDRNQSVPKFSKELLLEIIESGRIKNPKISHEDAKTLALQLIKIGNNLNQITRKVNTASELDNKTFWNLDKSLDEMKAEMSKLWQQLS